MKQGSVIITYDILKLDSTKTLEEIFLRQANKFQKGVKFDGMEVSNMKSSGHNIIFGGQFIYEFKSTDKKYTASQGIEKDISALDRDTWIALGFFLLGFGIVVAIITLYFYLKKAPDEEEDQQHQADGE